MVYAASLDHSPPDPARNAVPGGAGSVEERGLIVGAGLGRLSVGLAEALAGSHHEVRIFARVTSALRELHRIRPDTVVAGTDEGFPVFGNLLTEARAAGVPAVLALIDRWDGESVDRAMEAGAHDVVAPPHSARAVLLRRRVLLQSPPPAPAPGLKPRVVLGPLTVDLTARQVLDGSDPLTLSGREFELLVRLMESAGDVVSRTQLLADIWGTDQGSEAVLDATVHRLRRRLGEKLDGDELISTVRGVGYRLQIPDAEAEPALA